MTLPEGHEGSETEQHRVSSAHIQTQKRRDNDGGAGGPEGLNMPQRSFHISRPGIQRFHGMMLHKIWPLSDTIQCLCSMSLSRDVFLALLEQAKGLHKLVLPYPKALRPQAVVRANF